MKYLIRNDHFKNSANIEKADSTEQAVKGQK